MKDLGRVGVVGRWKPLHNGGKNMLESIIERSDHLVIGIGSCNKYNARNPFTAEESKGMIDALLSPRYSNYSTIFIPDFAQIPEYRDGQRWKEYVLEHYGKLDHFATGNEYVSDLLADSYHIFHPAELIPEDKQTRVRATQVRLEMARFGDWKKLVPEPVADYLENNGLVDRFRKEYGLETLSKLADTGDYRVESSDIEMMHTCER